MKAAFINIFKELKETTSTEVKEAMMAISHQIEEYQLKDRNYEKEPNAHYGVEKYTRVKWRIHKSG